MDGIIQSFYRHNERGQSVRTDKSKSFIIFHSSTRHTYEANVMLYFPGETAPPRPMVNTKVLGQTLASGEGGWEGLGRRLEGLGGRLGRRLGRSGWRRWMDKGGTVSATGSHLHLPHQDDVRYLYQKRFQPPVDTQEEPSEGTSD